MNIIFDLIKYKGHIPIYTDLYGIAYYLSQIISILFCLCYVHQFFFLILGTVKKAKLKKVKFNLHKIGVVIAARNESVVIGNLINSIKNNDYPQELIKIFVIADNCSDNTAQISRDKGCYVFERHDEKKIGKGYVLNYFFDIMHNKEEYAGLIPDAYIVVDADNVLKKDFISEINKTFDSGYEVVTSYRNAKNFGKNWITAAYGYWYLHESRHMNNPRMILKTSCAISGTGFLVSTKFVKKYNNWAFFKLTEDLQCTIEYILDDGVIGYCETAELYDEHPETFRQSCRQRLRWIKGSYQSVWIRTFSLIKKSFRKFSCWDMFTNFIPMVVLGVFSIPLFPCLSIIGLCMGDLKSASFSIITFLISYTLFYFVMFFEALLLCITEWKRIKTTPFKKIFYIFTYPIFIFSYIPLNIIALFKKVSWLPIYHKENLSLEDIENEGKPKKNINKKIKKIKIVKKKIKYKKLT